MKVLTEETPFELDDSEPAQSAGGGAFMDGAIAQRAIDAEDEWLTPPAIKADLGQFDLDPCSPIVRPWPTATHHYTIEDNGLRRMWRGRVWLNPPYDRFQINAWMGRLAEHGNGIALTFARTDTEWFQNCVFKRAQGILFLKGRITFLDVLGKPSRFNGGAPSCLIAYGAANREVLAASLLPGYFVQL